MPETMTFPVPGERLDGRFLVLASFWIDQHLGVCTVLLMDLSEERIVYRVVELCLRWRDIGPYWCWHSSDEFSNIVPAAEFYKACGGDI